MTGSRGGELELRCVYGAPRGRTSRVQERRDIPFPSRGRSVTVRPRFSCTRSNDPPHCITLEARGVAPRYEGGIRLKLSGPNRWPDGPPDTVACRLSWLREDGFSASVGLGLRARDRIVELERLPSPVSLLYPQMGLCQFSRQSYGTVLDIPMTPADFVAE